MSETGENRKKKDLYQVTETGMNLYSWWRPFMLEKVFEEKEIMFQL